jgi:hypothetical protein
VQTSRLRRNGFMRLVLKKKGANSILPPRNRDRMQWPQKSTSSPVLGIADLHSARPSKTKQAIPTGLNHSAQGCAMPFWRYPGSTSKQTTNPDRVRSIALRTPSTLNFTTPHRKRRQKAAEGGFTAPLPSNRHPPPSAAFSPNSQLSTLNPQLPNTLEINHLHQPKRENVGKGGLKPPAQAGKGGKSQSSKWEKTVYRAVSQLPRIGSKLRLAQPTTIYQRAAPPPIHGQRPNRKWLATSYAPILAQTLRTSNPHRIR